MDLHLFATSATWGVLVAGPFALLIGFRQRQFDAAKTVVVFLAGAAVPSYARLLKASLAGSVADLPPDWPTFAALAAVVALGLAIAQLAKEFRHAWVRAADPAQASTNPVASARGDARPQDQT
jgi:hypothetical protein